METLYIYKEPFNGSIVNTMSNGIVHYTGEEKKSDYIDENGSRIIEIRFENGLTFNQYNESEGGNLKVATSDEMDIILENFENSLVEDFKEITEEKHDYYFECLPPKRYHKNKGVTLFYLGECFRGNLYTCCGAIEGKYYSALRDITESSDSLAEAVLKVHSISGSEIENAPIK